MVTKLKTQLNKYKRDKSTIFTEQIGNIRAAYLYIIQQHQLKCRPRVLIGRKKKFQKEKYIYAPSLVPFKS